MTAPTVGAAPVGGDKTLTVRRITPSGNDVPLTRQLVLEFDRPMVPLGAMERRGEELPVRIEPTLACHWRWLNPDTLACNLDEKDALLPATAYRLTLSPGLVALDGATLGGAVIHQFATVRPRIGQSWFKTWLSPRLPQSVVRTNLAVHQESLAAHLFYQVEGRRIAAQVRQDPDYATGSDNRVWLVNPVADLPTKSPSRLQIEPGLQSVQGSLVGVEHRTVATLQTMPEPRLLGLRCRSKDDKGIEIPVGQSGAERRCLPSAGVSLLFSAPVLAKDLQHGLSFTPNLTASTDSDPWEHIPSYSQLYEPYDKNKRYSVDLPEHLLKPSTPYSLRLAANTVRDEFGRLLTEGGDLHFAMDQRAPDYALLKNLPVLEKDLDSDAQVWTVNLRELHLTYDRIAADGDKTPDTAILKPQQRPDTSIAVPLTLRTLLGHGSGVVRGHFTSVPPVADRGVEDGWFFAQITPFHVHLKLGHHNSLVWITDMHSGLPAADVVVDMIKTTFAEFTPSLPPLSSAVTDREGIAVLPGTTVLDPRLLHVYVGERQEQGLFLLCRKDKDMAVLPIRYDYQAAAEGANRQYIPDWLRPLHGHLKVWGATAQGIYKAGDTVNYKILLRDQDNLRLIPPPGAVQGSQQGKSGAGAAPTYSLKVIDPMGKVVHQQADITLSPFGAFHGEIALPPGGAVGWHRFVVGASFTPEEWEAMRVLVSDFTPAPFKVVTDLNGERFRQGDQVRITTDAKLHAGGPYGGASARTSALLETTPLTPDNPFLQGYRFDSLDNADEYARDVETIDEHQGLLDEGGLMGHAFTIPDSSILHGRLTVESAVQDDRGKTIAQRTTVPYLGRDRYIGLLQEDWTLEENRAATVRIAVIDEQGEMVAGTRFSLKSEEKVTSAARVKGAGDGYHHQYEHRWETVEEMSGLSAGEPLEIRFTPKKPGHLRLTATITDSRGRNHSTRIERWVTGAGRVLWEAPPGNLLSVYPEKNDYAVGDTARFLVHNPFPGARALITVERYGVIDRWSKEFTTGSEIIEIPIRADYLPGFYLSVLVASPRVEQPPGPQGEDLGKPTYRLGYVKVPVRDPYKELTVAITPRQQNYKPGENAEVDLLVTPRRPFTAHTPPVELAVAVVDEAVFDLLKDARKKYDPYQNFYVLEELDLSNYNLLMQLVGRENLALKGAAAAGDGGDFSLRSVFKYLAYWNPALHPDDSGKATISFPLPDNLTAWRVLAMAVTPEDRMGLGEGTFTVNQRTEIRPILPNQLLAGDNFAAGYTLVNRTDHTRTLKVRFQAEGPLRQDNAGDTPNTSEVTLAPFQRQVVRFPLHTTAPGELRLKLTAGDDLDGDGLDSRVTVHSNVRPITTAVFGTVEEQEIRQPVAFPVEMGEGGGRLQLSLSPTALGGLGGAFTYLRDYPYSCWEQKLSRGMLAAYFSSLAPYLEGSFSWPESDEVVRQTLAETATFQAPNGGMTYFQAQDQWVSPYLSAFTALSFNRMQLQGYEPPTLIEERLHGYLHNLLRHDSQPAEYNRPMTATVRAVALAALAERGKIDLNEVQRFHGQLESMSLLGRAFYLRALLAVGASPQTSRQVMDSLLAHADQSAGATVFSESLDAPFALLHVSTVRDSAAILSSLLAWLTTHPNDLSITDLSLRVMRGLTMARRGKAHWASTQENLFVVMALAEYARLFEAGEPRLETTATLDREAFGQGRFTAYNQPPLILQRAIAGDDAGKSSELRLEKSGEGRLYYGAHLSYFPTLSRAEAVNAGIEVFREYSVLRDGRRQLVDQDTVLRTGEVVRIDLYVSLPAERYFVVVDDPVPGGLEPVDRELATTSIQKEDDEPPPGSLRRQSSSWRSGSSGSHGFYHRELRHQAARFYSERLAAGRYHLHYSAQAIAPGRFQVPPLHAEEMYSPDIYGDSAPSGLTIEVAP
jgi:hypothetical protein